MAAWIDECCVIDPLHWESGANLFASWSAWATRSGEFVGSQKRFVERLENRPGMEPMASAERPRVPWFRGFATPIMTLRVTLTTAIHDDESSNPPRPPRKLHYHPHTYLM